MHIVKALERRFPKHKRSITAAAVLFSLGLLLLGVGVMIIR